VLRLVRLLERAEEVVVRLESAQVADLVPAHTDERVRAAFIPVLSPFARRDLEEPAFERAEAPIEEALERLRRERLEARHFAQASEQRTVQLNTTQRLVLRDVIAASDAEEVTELLGRADREQLVGGSTRRAS
jgi:hypothetical protein